LKIESKCGAKARYLMGNNLYGGLYD
jgi:hypothetical protein